MLSRTSPSPAGNIVWNAWPFGITVGNRGVAPGVVGVIVEGAGTRCGVVEVVGAVVHAPGGVAEIIGRAVGRGVRFQGAISLSVPVLTLSNAAGVVAQDRGGIFSTPIANLAATVGAFRPAAEFFFDPRLVYGSALAATLGAGTWSCRPEA